MKEGIVAKESKEKEKKTSVMPRNDSKMDSKPNTTKVAAELQKATVPSTASNNNNQIAAFKEHGRPVIR